MAWTTPRTWVASEVVTASIMNTHVRDNLNALRDGGSFTGGATFGGAVVISSPAAAAALTIPATGRFYLDSGGGSGNTWIYESAADVVSVVTGGNIRFTVAAAYAALPATVPLYFDGGTHTYISETSDNNLRCVSGGSGGVELTSGATAWSAVSDERLKIIAEAIRGATDKVGALRAVIGRLASDDDAVRRPMLIAQDVQRVLPEAVTEGADGYLRMAYTEVIPLLVAAIQELTARVAALEATRA